MTISVAHRAVRNAASIALADAVAGASSVRFYDAQGGALLGQRTLATPCGSINAEGRIVLIAAAAQDLVQAVAVFRLDAGSAYRPVARSAAAPAPRTAPPAPKVPATVSAAARLTARSPAPAKAPAGGAPAPEAAKSAPAE